MGSNSTEQRLPSSVPFASQSGDFSSGSFSKSITTSSIYQQATGAQGMSPQTKSPGTSGIVMYQKTTSTLLPPNQALSGATDALSLTTDTTDQRSHRSVTTIDSGHLDKIVTMTASSIKVITLDPSGIEATSSAHALQTGIILAQRAASEYAMNSKNTASKSEALASIASAALFANHFKGRLPEDGAGGGGGSSGSCSSGKSLLGSLVGAVTCASHTLNDLTSGIKGGKDIDGEIKDLGGLVKPLDPSLPEPDPPPNAKPASPSDTTPEEESDKEEDEDEDKGKGTSSSTINARSSTGETTTTSIQSTSASSASSVNSSQTITSAATMTGAKAQYLVFASTRADVSSIGGFINSTVNNPGAVGYSPPDTNDTIPGIWVVPDNQNAAPTAGLNASQAAVIGRLPGVSLIVTNAMITMDTDPATSVSSIFAISVSTDQVTCSANPQTASNTPLIRRITNSEQSEVQGQDPASSQQQNEFEVPWELRAISQPKTENPLPPLDQLNYVYLTPAGEGTWVYMIDTGVDRNHHVRILHLHSFTIKTILPFSRNQ